MRLCDRPKGTDQIAVRHAAGAGRFAGETAEATIDVRLRALPWQISFQHLFHQDDASARRVHLLAQFGIRWARSEAETAMDASLHCMGHRLAQRAEFFWFYRVLHLSSSEGNRFCGSSASFTAD